MPLPNINDLTTPPVVGRFYNVPCIKTAGFYVPIIGPAHKDKEVGFDHLHYHYDFRFIGQDILRDIFHMPLDADEWETQARLSIATGTVASVHTEAEITVEAHCCLNDPEARKARIQERLANQTPTLCRKKCVRTAFAMPAKLPTSFDIKLRRSGSRRNALVANLETVCAGRRILDVSNPVCPHKGASLKGQPVDTDNCVTCPLHGLRWSLTTGEMVPHFPAEPVGEAQA